MKRFIAAIFYLFAMISQVQAAILIESSSGVLVPGTATMAAACAQTNPVHVTSVLSATQSNYSSATQHICLAPVNIHTGGGLSNTTTFHMSQFTAGLYQTFFGSGAVAFLPGAVSELLPEWWGAVANATTSGGGTDSTSALQSALNVPVIPVRLSGNYLFSNLTMPGNKLLDCTDIHSTALIAKTGSTGTMFTDQGSAAKLSLRSCAFYGRNQSYTGGLVLGYGTSPFGTEGRLDVWVRDLPAGFPGIDIDGNVGHYDYILGQNTGGVRILDSPMIARTIQSMSSQGFPQSGITGNVGTVLQDGSVSGIEIEATASGVTPLYLLGNTQIGTATIAPPPGATYDHLIEISAAATNWSFGNILYYYNSGSGVVVSNGNIKSGTYYFGGNATGSSGYPGTGQGAYTSVTQGQQPISFTLVFNNISSVTHHKIIAPGGNVSNFVSKINGASTSFVITPTSTDASTAMANGAKIGATSPSIVYFDTPNQLSGNFIGTSVISYNNTGTAYTVLCSTGSININGITATRLFIQLISPTTGNGVNWSTALGTSNTIQVQFNGMLN